MGIIIGFNAADCYKLQSSFRATNTGQSMIPAAKGTRIVNLPIKRSFERDRLRWTDAWLMLRYAVLSLHYAFGGAGGARGGKA